MATVYLTFHPDSARFKATGFAAPVVAQGTNFPIAGLAFDAAADEEAYFSFRAINYASGNLTLDLEWYADTGTSGDVIWGCQIAAITPNTDTQDIETDALATVQTVTDTHLGTTGQRLHRATITISNLDSLAADDWVVLRIYRDADAAGDTMAGDAILALAALSYLST